MIDAFYYKAHDFRGWRSVGEALAYHAELLTQHKHQEEERIDQYQQSLQIEPVDMAFSSLILWGYSIECFLKCLFVKEGGRLIKDGKIKGVTNHNLCEMAKKANFDLTNSERVVLQNLSKIILWSGRYPVARTALETSQPHYWSTPQDDYTINAFVEKLRVEIAR